MHRKMDTAVNTCLHPSFLSTWQETTDKKHEGEQAEIALKKIWNYVHLLKYLKYPLKGIDCKYIGLHSNALNCKIWGENGRIRWILFCFYSLFIIFRVSMSIRCVS